MKSNLTVSVRTWAARRTAWMAPAVLGLSLALPLLGGCSDLMNHAVTSSGEDRNKGVQLYNEGSYAEAAGAFQTAVKQQPGDYRSHYYLGRSYEAMKAYQQATASYRTALEVSKRDYDTAERNAFQVKILDGLASAIANGPGADAEIAALQQKHPRTAEDQLLLAKTFRQRGDVDSALEAYHQASLVDPNSLPVAKEYGLYLVQINQPDKARPQLKRAYVLNRRTGQGEDEQVVTALRGVGVIPGPSLGEERDLVQPPLPQGPLPEVDVSKINPFGGDQPQGSGDATSSVER